MPVLHIHIPESAADASRARRLLEEGSRVYADALECPVDRVRLFLHTYAPGMAAVGGQVLEQGDQGAPFFSCYAMADRAQAQIDHLMAQLTALIADILVVPPAVIRAECKRVPPTNWYIAGESAATKRKVELEARAAAQPPVD